MKERARPFTPRGGRLALLVPALALAAAAAKGARAAEGDGAYGRLDGDVTFVGGLSGGVVADTARTVGHVEVRARYLDAAGLFFGFEEADAFSKATSQGELRRAFLAGVELRPLFPIRFFRHEELGPRFGDLVLDSLGLELGGVFSQREGRSTGRPGFLLGLGVEIPIVGQASGPWLRLEPSVRWAPEQLDGDVDEPGGRTIVLLVGLAWHQVVATHLVDAGDEAPK